MWFTKRIHDTWKVVKGLSSFNFDLTFDSEEEEVQKSIVAVRQQDVLKSLWR